MAHNSRVAVDRLSPNEVSKNQDDGRSRDCKPPAGRRDSSIRASKGVHQADLAISASDEDLRRTQALCYPSDEFCHNLDRVVYVKAFVNSTPSHSVECIFSLFQLLLSFTAAHYSLARVGEKYVPEDETFYWWKRVLPAVLFGSKHAMLLQAALIPLTMSRYSIATLSDTFLDRFIPLNRAQNMHIYLGYVFVILVVGATAIFVAYFGTLCALGEQMYCQGLSQEIMITGFTLTAIILVVAATSYFRNSIPYEVFYVVHHMVFILYALIVLHTIDGPYRSGHKKRHQTFAWVSFTLLFYLCDRAVLHINHKYMVRLVASSTVAGRNGCNTVIIKLRRPVLFDFKPGQYAFIRLAGVDTHWHPFSMASSPSSSNLEFYIEVFGEDSWTRKLFDILHDPAKQGSNSTRAPIDFEVMGPYGTSLGKTDDYSHALAVGSGTGAFHKQDRHGTCSSDRNRYISTHGTFSIIRHRAPPKLVSPARSRPGAPRSARPPCTSQEAGEEDH